LVAERSHSKVKDELDRVNPLLTAVQLGHLLSLGN